MTDQPDGRVSDRRDPFARLRDMTPARIGLGRSGDSLPLAVQLDLQAAHARARDAVQGAVDWASVARDLRPFATRRLRSRAADRATYLRRPDLGRRLHPDDLAGLPEGTAAGGTVFVVADGLSAAAVQAHAAPTVAACAAALGSPPYGTVLLLEQGRVAIGDEIGERLGAGLVIVAIGERPGLTVADSLGLYLTCAPRVGRADSERNCISNVHARGLSYGAAAELVHTIATAAVALGRTGVHLKVEAPSGTGAFLGKPAGPMLQAGQGDGNLTAQERGGE